MDRIACDSDSLHIGGNLACRLSAGPHIEFHRDRGSFTVFPEFSSFIDRHRTCLRGSVSFPADSEQQLISSMSSPGVLARNAVANLVQPGIAWIVVLALPPLLVRTLDKSSYATWMLLLQISAYITLLNASVQTVIMHFVARARSLRDDEYMARMLSSSGLVLLVTAAIAVVFIAITSSYLPVLFRSIPPAVVREASLAILLIGCSLAVGHPFSVLAGVFGGYQRSEIPAVASAIGRFSGAIGVGWAAYHRQGLIPMAIWTAAGNLLLPAAYVTFWLRWGKQKLFRISRVTGAAVREFLAFWSGLLVSQFCGLLISGLDLPIVAAFDFPAAAYYAVASTLANILVVPQSAIMAAILPVISSLSAHASPQRLGLALVKVTRYGTAILILLSLPLLFGMSIFLHLWVGSNYEVHALPFGIVLVLAVLLRASMRPYSQACLSAGQQQRALISPIVEAAVNVGLSLWLVHRIGALGVALGTLIGAVVGVLVHLTVSMHFTNAIRVDRVVLVSKGMLRPLLCAVPAVLFLVAVQRRDPPALVHAIAIVLGEIMAAVALLLGNFDSQERVRFFELARQFAKAMAGGSASAIRDGAS